jgi:hypothetical protein
MSHDPRHSLTHEVWASADGTEHTLTIAGPRGSSTRALLSNSHRVIHRIYATSWHDAMAQLHKYMGWESYVAMPGDPDVPYPVNWKTEQISAGIE